MPFVKAGASQVPKLTRKQKDFADELLRNPAQSATQAVMKTYQPTTYGSARALASQNLAHPAIQIYMSQHVQKARNRVVNLIDSKREDIALRASQDVLDRTQGKAGPREGQTNVGSITINFGNSGSTKPEVIEGELV